MFCIEKRVMALSLYSTPPEWLSDGLLLVMCSACHFVRMQIQASIARGGDIKSPKVAFHLCQV
jgi:hypothetical protein